MGPICANGILHADEEAYGAAAAEFGVGIRGRHVLVLVVDVGEGHVGPAADASVRNWREGLGRLEDPYLAVEPLRETP